MDNAGSTFFVFSLSNPHVGERGQSSDNRTTDPDGESSLRGGNNLNFHGGRGEVLHFFGESFSNTLVHGRSSGKDNIGIEVFSDIDISLHD